ncbi:MAG: glycosyltransferase family 4 protein [Oligoflexia bacterium]|nr:glycosyltransferase family 4 protein [Oligoflexia bacterium]
MPFIKESGHEGPRVIITTPDYPPKLGGLSTFASNIRKSLLSIGIRPDIFVWTNYSELKDLNQHQGYDFALHIHYMAGHSAKKIAKKHINFIHGSEILFHSPNPIKKFVKNVLKRGMLDYLETSHFNFFISSFTKNKLCQKGYASSCERDVVFHNCIDTVGAKRVTLQDRESILRFVCVARDVPHKNMDGTVKFLEKVQTLIPQDIELFVTAENRWPSSKIKIHSIKNISDEEREKVFQRSHYNILLSLDHSHLGFYEGFGLTVLEAGKYGIPSVVSPYGGLPEAVHHRNTGIVLDDTLSAQIFVESHDEYLSLSRQVFEHTNSSHSLIRYDDLLGLVFKNNIPKENS